MTASILVAAGVDTIESDGAFDTLGFSNLTAGADINASTKTATGPANTTFDTTDVRHIAKGNAAAVQLSSGTNGVTVAVEIDATFQDVAVLGDVTDTGTASVLIGDELFAYFGGPCSHHTSPLTAG